MTQRLRASLTVLTVLALGACGPTTAPPADGDDDGARDAWGGVELPAATCVGNGDGVLEASEVVLAPELAPVAAFLVDDADRSVSGLNSRWNLDFEADPSDAVRFLGPEGLEGAWFEAAFPTSDFHALTDVGGGGRSVYAIGGGELLLTGIASDEVGAFRLAYDPPVPVLPVPLAAGDTWEVTAEASGFHDGQEYPADFGLAGEVTLEHRYAFEVVAHDVVTLPAADLPAHLVRLDLETTAVNSITGPFASESVRVDLLVAECLGVVARLRSQPDESDPDFTTAVEVMRLGLDPDLLP